MRITLFTLVGTALICAGCDSASYTQQYTVQDYLEHPSALEKQLDNCDANKASKSTQCNIAAQALTILQGYIKEMQTDPEQFGQKILDAEMAYAQLHDKLLQLQQDSGTLASQGADTSVVNAAINQTAQAADQKRHEVKALLAVSGLSSPD